MNKPGKNSKEPVEALVNPPYVAIARIGKQDFLLFDSRIEFDQTRTLRVIELSSLNNGVFVVEPASQEESIHSFKISFWPQSATSQENIVELAVVTVDFAAEPLHISEQQHRETKPGAEQADIFLQALRNRTLAALCDVFQAADEHARQPASITSRTSDPTEHPTHGASVHYLADTSKKMDSDNRPAAETTGNWICGIVAVFIATAFLLALIAYSIS